MMQSTEIRAISFNADGLLTKVGKCLRMDLILKFAIRMNLDILCLQEPHTDTHDKLKHTTEYFALRGYTLLCPITDEGRGGSAIAIKNTWNIVSHTIHSQRIMHACISSNGGDVISVASVHMHHRCNIRTSQWGKLLHETFALPPNTLIFGDFNSVMLPSRDIASPASGEDTPTHGPADGARRLEMEYIGQKRLLDVYAAIHSHQANQGDLGGWTWGFPRASAQPPGEPVAKKHKPSANDAPPRDRRRRIDRILIPDNMLPNVSSCYPHFLANSDHKALVLTLSPVTYSPPHKRKRCPESFLSSETAVEGIKEHISTLPSDCVGTAWWSHAQAIIRQHAYHYESSVNVKGVSEVQAHVMESSRQKVTDGGWSLLKDRGIYPPSQSEAYTSLCGLLDNEFSDRTGLLVLNKIKQALADPYEHTPGNRKKEIWRLTKQLQTRKRLLRLRNQTGVLTDPEAIAKEITSFWAGIMNNGGASEEACFTYLNDFFEGKDMNMLVKALYKPLSIDVVLKALDNLQPTAAPGYDGFVVKIYKAFKENFAPHMVLVIEEFLRTGEIPQHWSLALLNPIPKVPGDPAAKDLRPLVLQNTCLKWISATIALQLSDLISQITPKQQKGFIKGRFMQDHLFNAFGCWHDLDSGCFLFIDFAKAFDSVTHQYATVFFTRMCLPPELIRLILALFRSPMALVINGGVCFADLIRPTSGIRQGCPLSPALFALLVSPIIRKILRTVPNVIVLLYADDLLIIFTGPPDSCIPAVGLCCEILQDFTFHVGLDVNRDKSAILLKGKWAEFDIACVTSQGWVVKDRYKYLGVFLGDIPPQEAYASALARAMGRACIMRNWNLSLEERQALLELWITPLLLYPASVVPPDQHVLSAVNNIYLAALGLNSWGLTVKIMAQPRERGGLGLVPPKVLLQWQHGQAFVKFFRRPHIFLNIISRAYHAWADPLGICISLVNFHLFQLATVRLTGIPFIGTSALSFSRARKGSVFDIPPNLPAAVPLWHNVLFRNRAGGTYYSPDLVRKGVLSSAQMSEGMDGVEQLIQNLPMLTKSVYRAAFKRIRLSEDGCFAPYHVPGFWLNWTKKPVALHLSTSCYVTPRQPASVWKQFLRVTAPTHFTDFVRRALWLKLPVGARLVDWIGGSGHCPYHAVVEDHPHALGACLFHEVIESCVTIAFPGQRVDVSANPEHSLATQRGLFTWTGVYAHWQMRKPCLVNDPQRPPPPPLQQFLRTWSSALNEWPLVQHASIPTHLVKAFVDGIDSFTSRGSFTFHTPTVQPGSLGNKRKSAFSTGLKHNWRVLLLEAQQRIREVEAEGRLVVFTDGSSIIHDDIGPVAGFGAYFGSELDFSDFVPTREQQSNNRAELRALLKCLQITHALDSHTCWAFAIDSKYVVDGATGGAATWRDSYWVTKSGKGASHIDLWLEVLPLLEALGHRAHVFHVYSHINLYGNDQADALANKGRESSPLFSYLLPGASPCKRTRLDSPEVAEISVILSSDEELVLSYQSAKKRFRESGARVCDSPRPHRSPTPTLFHLSDFDCVLSDSECATPEPPESQDFPT